MQNKTSVNKIRQNSLSFRNYAQKTKFRSWNIKISGQGTFWGPSEDSVWPEVKEIGGRRRRQGYLQDEDSIAAAFDASF